ncbi:MAG TPA: hypothetical protein VJ861_10685 [Treponemataceae bacterium]|nr:hypothetical protein [Treponemataceae bacterium]
MIYSYPAYIKHCESDDVFEVEFPDVPGSAFSRSFKTNPTLKTLAKLEQVYNKKIILI